MRACVRACVSVCVRACVCVCVSCVCMVCVSVKCLVLPLNVESGTLYTQSLLLLLLSSSRSTSSGGSSSSNNSSIYYSYSYSYFGLVKALGHRLLDKTLVRTPFLLE